MQEHRHPHPHVDPRQPRCGTVPGTNPPVFAWKPLPTATAYSLTVARDADLRDVVLQVDGLADPLHLPESAFPPGEYHWRWSAGGDEAETFSFTIAPDAVVLEVPPADEWLRRLPSSHPRIYLRPEDVGPLRESRTGSRAAAWAELQAAADTLLAQPHTIDEPPNLPDRDLDYQQWVSIWADIMWQSRNFVAGAETLGLAWLASGDARYGRAACERMASISHWDPHGSSHLVHNDEAHMSVIWHGANACDWVWELFTDEERERVIAQFAERGRITYEHMHGRGSYGVTRFDSHAGREIVFLAHIAMVFHEHVPEARDWLAWLRPVLCGIWPVWAGDDGAWAEGPSYGLAYVSIMSMFATALRRGAGIDLYRRPFWRNHARWRRSVHLPYAEWLGFGDHTERWGRSWRSAADLVEIIDHATGAREHAGYIADLRREATTLSTPASRDRPGASAQRYLLEPAPPGDEHRAPMLSVFGDAGWAAVRTAEDDPARDVAFLFRSSPYGAVSHSHANNNDFILHAGGKVLAMPSGYYAGYGSPHHAHWVWHTKSHNCLTLSDASQQMRSYESTGSIDAPHEDDALVYFRGTADASYPTAARCRRHVVYLKPGAGRPAGGFLLVDEFVAEPGWPAAVQWNVHSWAEFETDDAARRFRLEREGVALEGQVLHHATGYFTLTHGWEPPPTAWESRDQWHMQHHLRYTPSGLLTRLNLGVVLVPALPGDAAAELSAGRRDGVETVTLGDATAAISPGGTWQWGGRDTEALVELTVGGRGYRVMPEGLERGD